MAFVKALLNLLHFNVKVVARSWKHAVQQDSPLSKTEMAIMQSVDWIFLLMKGTFC